jgi:hypothetical protein
LGYVREDIGASMRAASDLPIVDVRIGNGRRARTSVGRDALGVLLLARTVHHACQQPCIGPSA